MRTKGRKYKTRKEIVRAVAGETHQNSKDGETTDYSTLDFVLLKLRERALKGAQKELQRLIEAYKPEQTGDLGGVLVVDAEVTREEFFEQLRERDERMMQMSYEEKYGVRKRP